MEKHKAFTSEGVEVFTPIVLDLASDPYVRLDGKDRQRYFSENGYVVVRGVIPKHLCELVTSTYQQTCKSAELERRESEGEEGYAYNGYLVREIFFRPGREHRHPTLKDICDALVHDSAITGEVSNLLGDNSNSGTFIYFESSRGTGIHRDIDPEDANKPYPEFIGTWIALRDISHGSARLFVCPGSHKLEVPAAIPDFLREDLKNVQQSDIQKNGVQRYSTKRYERALSQYAVDKSLEFRAPIVNAGDVVFFNKKLFHGSLFVANPDLSRDSLVVFYSR